MTPNLIIPSSPHFLSFPPSTPFPQLHFHLPHSFPPFSTLFAIIFKFFIIFVRGINFPHSVNFVDPTRCGWVETNF